MSPTRFTSPNPAFNTGVATRFGAARTFHGLETHHAIRLSVAELALEHAGNVNGPIAVTCECQHTGLLKRHRAVADDDEPQLVDEFTLTADWRYCPTCLWSVAVETGRTDAALDVVTPTPADQQVLTRQGLEPRLVRQVCEVLLADQDTPHAYSTGPLIQLLAYATEHAPLVLVPDSCRDSDCDHISDTPTNSTCPLPDVDVICPGCTRFTGNWAGRYKGQPLIDATIDAPCTVLLKLAERFAVGPWANEPDHWLDTDSTVWTAAA